MRSRLCFAPLAILLLTIIDLSLEKSIEVIETQINSGIINGYDTHYKYVCVIIFNHIKLLDT